MDTNLQLLQSTELTRVFSLNTMIFIRRNELSMDEKWTDYCIPFSILDYFKQAEGAEKFEQKLDKKSKICGD